MIPNQEARAAIEFSRPGVFLAPQAGYLTQGDRAQMLGLWRGLWDPSAIQISLVIGPAFDIDMELGEAVGVRLEIQP